MKILRAIGYLLLALTLAPAAAQACMAPSVPSFRQELSKAHSVEIVRVESISLLPQQHKDIVIVPDMVARIRTTEVLAGQKSEAELVRFTGSWCGGHNLKVGEYYVLLVDRDSRIVELPPGSQSIVYLFGEYSERNGSSKSDSALLLHLRNFARLGYFPDDFPIDKLLEHNRVTRAVTPRI